MTTFYYEASTPKGKIVKQTIEADSINQARILLKNQNLYIIDIAINQATTKKLKTVAESISAKNSINYHVPKKYVIDFTRQFATLLDASLPIDQVLSLLAKDQAHKNLTKIVQGIKSDVNEGLNLAKALSKYPKVFSNLYIALVSAGQESGKLNIIMLQLADYLEEQQKIKQQVQHAFAYPFIVTLIAIGIIVYLMTNIIPKIVDVFMRHDQALPILTKVIISVSNFISNYGWYCLLCIIACSILFSLCLKNIKIAYAFDKCILKLPILKKISIGANSAKFSSTLAILTHAGIPILKGLEAGKNTTSNLVIQKEITLALEQVKQGSSLANALKTSHFPNVMIHLIKTGESTGKLAHMLKKISEQQAQNIRQYVLFLTTLLEPLLIVAMGVIVLTIVLGILLPIININQFVS
jgi:general secretion pathway protein F